MLGDDLDYFLALAGAGSMARAAERLGITQPALSKAIQRLERKVGVALIVRSAQGSELTEAGRAFRVRMGAVSRDMEDALQNARDLGGGHAGVLRIGATPAATSFTLSALLPALTGERPAARVSFTTAFSDVLLDALGRREIELALGPLPDRLDAGLEMTPLVRDAYMLIVNNKHPLARKKGVTLADLASCDWAGSSKHEFARVQMERVFTQHGLALPRIMVEANNMPALLLVVSRTGLASMVNSLAVLPARLPSNVKMLPILSNDIYCPIGMAWRKGYLSPIAQRAKELLMAAAGKQ